MNSLRIPGVRMPKASILLAWRILFFALWVLIGVGIFVYGVAANYAVGIFEGLLFVLVGLIWLRIVYIRYKEK